MPGIKTNYEIMGALPHMIRDSKTVPTTKLRKGDVILYVGTVTGITPIPGSGSSLTNIDINIEGEHRTLEAYNDTLWTIYRKVNR